MGALMRYGLPVSSSRKSEGLPDFHKKVIDELQKTNMPDNMRKVTI